MNILELVAGYFGCINAEGSVNSWSPYVGAPYSLELWGHYVMVRELEYIVSIMLCLLK